VRAAPRSAAGALAREQPGQQLVTIGVVLAAAPTGRRLLGDRGSRVPTGGAGGVLGTAAAAGVRRLVVDRIEFEVGERTQPGQ
jgi:hypothetical protein